jgi:hypothetical protein
MPSRRTIVYPQGGGSAVVVPVYNQATDVSRFRKQSKVFAQSAATVSRTGRYSLGNVGPAVSNTYKWNPGQYMASAVYTRLGNVDAGGGPAQPTKFGEIDLLRAGPAGCLGWEGVYFGRALWNSGSFDGSTSGGGFDADYVRCTGYVSGSRGSAVYTSPRLFAPYIFQTDYFSANPTVRSVADAILNNSSLTPIGPDGVHYGYWTVTGSGGSGTGSSPAAYRAAVAAIYGGYYTSMSAHVLPDGWTVNESPYIPWVKLYLESAAWIPQGAGDGSYSNSGMQSGLNTIHAAAKNAFTQTIVTANINYMADDNEVYTAANNAVALKMAFGGPDVFGYSSGQNKGNGLSALTPGQCAYIGLAPTGPNNVSWPGVGTDHRSVLPYLATIQNTELIASYGAYYTPGDITNQLNLTLQAPMAAWQYVDATNPDALSTAKWLGSAPNLGAWNQATSGGVLANMLNNSLTHTTYPSGL